MEFLNTLFSSCSKFMRGALNTDVKGKEIAMKVIEGFLGLIDCSKGFEIFFYWKYYKQRILKVWGPYFFLSIFFPARIFVLPKKTFMSEFFFWQNLFLPERFFGTNFFRHNFFPCHCRRDQPLHHSAGAKKTTKLFL